MAQRGTQIVQFRVSPDLRDALRDFAEANGLTKADGSANESAAARVLLLTILAVDGHGNARAAAAKAASEEVVWATMEALRDAIGVELPKLVQRATKRLGAG